MASKKELALRMEKVFDFPDKEAEKYEILAYFKEKEEAKNRQINSMIEGAIATPIASGSSQTGSSASNITQQATQVDNSRNQSRIILRRSFSTTDLLLSIIAFFLFVLIIIHN